MAKRSKDELPIFKTNEWKQAQNEYQAWNTTPNSNPVSSFAGHIPNTKAGRSAYYDALYRQKWAAPAPVPTPNNPSGSFQDSGFAVLPQTQFPMPPDAVVNFPGFIPQGRDARNKFYDQRSAQRRSHGAPPNTPSPAMGAAPASPPPVAIPSAPASVLPPGNNAWDHTRKPDWEEIGGLKGIAGVGARMIGGAFREVFTGKPMTPEGVLGPTIAPVVLGTEQTKPFGQALTELMNSGASSGATTSRGVGGTIGPQPAQVPSPVSPWADNARVKNMGPQGSLSRGASPREQYVTAPENDMSTPQGYQKIQGDVMNWLNALPEYQAASDEEKIQMATAKMNSLYEEQIALKQEMATRGYSGGPTVTRRSYGATFGGPDTASPELAAMAGQHFDATGKQVTRGIDFKSREFSGGGQAVSSYQAPTITLEDRDALREARDARAAEMVGVHQDRGTAGASQMGNAARVTPRQSAALRALAGASAPGTAVEPTAANIQSGVVPQFDVEKAQEAAYRSALTAIGGMSQVEKLQMNTALPNSSQGKMIAAKRAKFESAMSSNMETQKQAYALKLEAWSSKVKADAEKAGYDAQTAKILAEIARGGRNTAEANRLVALDREAVAPMVALQNSTDPTEQRAYAAVSMMFDDGNGGINYTPELLTFLRSFQATRAERFKDKEAAQTMFAIELERLAEREKAKRMQAEANQRATAPTA
jgi:hypothetical protein